MIDDDGRKKKFELLSKKKKGKKPQNNIFNTVLNNMPIPKVFILAPASN